MATYNSLGIEIFVGDSKSIGINKGNVTVSIVLATTYSITSNW